MKDIKTEDTADSVSQDPDVVTTAARLMVGAASLGLDGVRALLGAPDVKTVDLEAGHRSSGPQSVSEAVVGLAARGVPAAVSAGKRGAAFARRGARTTADVTSRAIRWATPTFMREPLDRAKDRAVDGFRGLSDRGLEEFDRSRLVTRAVIDEVLDGVFARLAESRELQLVIRAQSVGAAEEGVHSLRDKVAGLDNTMERSARRLIRRPKQTT
jgi:hypothetical protein